MTKRNNREDSFFFQENRSRKNSRKSSNRKNRSRVKNALKNYVMHDENDPDFEDEIYSFGSQYDKMKENYDEVI